MTVKVTAPSGVPRLTGLLTPDDCSAHVIDQGPPGPQGPAGAAGGGTYTHTQSTALAVWTVAHNLNRRPSITVVTNLDQRIEPDVTYVDANTVQITHAAAQIGKVYCN